MASPLAPPASAAAASGGWLDRLLRRRLIALLEALADGELRILEPGGLETRLGTAVDPRESPLRATVTVHDPAFWTRLGLGGTVGAGEAWMDGLWDCDDLVALVRLLLRNRERLDALEGGGARVAAAALRLLHLLRRNTRAGARRNVAAHYDLGNEFFALFLDERWRMYSCAMYLGEEESLEQAQERRLEAVCRKLELAPGDRVIEIGSGWGGFACYAAERFGCRVTTTTISRRQAEYCRRVVAERGLGDRVEVLEQDYRDLEGRYDKLVSLEMIEAVGHEYLGAFFAKVGELLAPHGMALVQAITIEERRYERARRSVDFIKRHVFPGSFIPALAPMLAAIARASDLRLFHLEDIGPSYALTLREWRRRFLAREAEVAALGFDRRFRRMWEFYLAYCEGGFLERALGDVQMLLVKPRCRRASLLAFP